MKTQAQATAAKTRKIIRIDEEKCNGCGECVTSCAEGAIQIIDGKARLVSETYCDGLGACLGHCPEDALSIEERPADEFDEEAVARHLQTQLPAPRRLGGHPAGLPTHLMGHGGGGCPSAAVRSMKPREAVSGAPLSADASALTQWPIQLHLVPPTAPFLKGADLLLAADCVPFAYGSFHRDLLKGRALLIACPKLDETDPYLPKLVEILKRCDIKSLTVAHMEVPCCHGLLHMVKEALQESGAEVPLRTVNIGIDGQVRFDSDRG